MRSLLLAALLASPAVCAKAIWVDTDAAAPDDQLALLQILGSPELSVRGVSIVTGEADPEASLRAAQQIVQSAAVSAAMAASDALTEALRHERLTVLALGPATNVAAVVRSHPDLVPRFEEILLVAGRRPGQHFTPLPASAERFRDFNFEADTDSFRVLLESKIPLILISRDASSDAFLTRADLAALAARPAAAAALEAGLNVWETKYRAPGFPPVDTLAPAYLVDRRDLSCSLLTARIENANDDTSTAFPVPQKPYLIARRHAVGKTVTFCEHASRRFKENLLRRLER